MGTQGVRAKKRLPEGGPWCLTWAQVKLKTQQHLSEERGLKESPGGPRHRSNTTPKFAQEELFKLNGQGARQIGTERPRPESEKKTSACDRKTRGLLTSGVGGA